MAENKRNYQQIEQDRVEMNRLALEGVPQAEIATQFGVSQPQVAYDLRVVRQRWKETTNMNIEAARDRELAQLDKIEMEAWAGLKRAELRGDGGEAKFAAILLRASEQRANLLGLFENLPKPTVAGVGVDPNVLGRVRIALVAKIRRELLQEYGLPEKPVSDQITLPTGVTSVEPAQT